MKYLLQFPRDKQPKRRSSCEENLLHSSSICHHFFPLLFHLHSNNSTPGFLPMRHENCFLGLLQQVFSWKFFPLVVIQLLSHVPLFATLWTAACQRLHYLLEFAQTHVHGVGDAIQPPRPLSPPSPPALNLTQHQGIFQRVGSSHQVAKVLELQRQSLQWIFRVEIL